MNTETESRKRIQDIARRAGMERSLYLGEAIGNALAIAWQTLGSVGGLFRRESSRAHRLS